MERLRLALCLLLLGAAFTTFSIGWYIGSKSNMSIRVIDTQEVTEMGLPPDQSTARHVGEYVDGPVVGPVVDISDKWRETVGHSSKSSLYHDTNMAKRHLNHALGEQGKSNELDIILSRVNTCLESTNLTLYFKSKGYYDRVQTDADRLLTNLRKVIPPLRAPYTVPCWKTSFQVTWINSRTTKATRNVKGHIGDFNFSYKVPDNLLKLKNLNAMESAHLSHRGTQAILEKSVVCLPKIFLLGYAKSGSTYLYCLLHRIARLVLGVGGVCQVEKEPHWWVHFGTQPQEPDYILTYLLNFKTGAMYRERNMAAVTIDASPNLMWQSPRYSEDETMENYCLMPSLIPVILPDSKYFVIMRNPITMLYSAFWFSCTSRDKSVYPVKYQGPDIFHERIIKKITIFNNCKDQGIHLDKCVNMVGADLYTPELPKCGRTRLEMSLYYFHTRKWLSVVPRERIHFFTMEELATQDITHTAKAILDHLELPLFSAINMGFAAEDLQNCNENTQHKIDYKHDPRLKMREDTKQILEEFFQPYNKMLADLLGDEKFLWE